MATLFHEYNYEITKQKHTEHIYMAELFIRSVVIPGYALYRTPHCVFFSSICRMCLQCGIPKTYSHAQGMVCPVCNDRPVQAKEPEKKKGSAVKDKEKVKRMRGQSSHASWKSETEMALRQQFD